MSKENKVGLILTGGGARAAYQAGALDAISEMTQKWGIKNPFPIISGNSAGSINAAYLSSGAHQKQETIKKLRHMWETIHSKKVYEIGSWPLVRMAFRWLFELSTGNLFSSKKSVRSLFDTSPLLRLIEEHIDFEQIHKNILSGDLHSFSIKAANYTTGYSETFFMGADSIPPWQRRGRFGQRTNITARHILASTAIPLLFPAVKINGAHYGDGSLRNYTPFSPPIKMGAKKLLVVGVSRSIVESYNNNPTAKPTIARILSLILNSVLLDAIDLDMERLERMNKTLESLHDNSDIYHRKIKMCMIRPSHDIGKIASRESKAMPKAVSHLMRGLGTRKEASDLISYLLFEPEYTKRLTELGYKDAYAQEEELKRFYLEA